jgi:hypothetical protein
MVVEADLQFLEVLGHARGAGREDRREHAAAENRHAGHAADIGDMPEGQAEIVIFDFQRPGRRQRLLDADARRSAPKRHRLRVGIGEFGDAADVARHVDMIDRPGDAALAIDERVAGRSERIADPRGHRAGRAGPALAGRADLLLRAFVAGDRAVGASDTRIGLDAEHPGRARRLPIVAELAAGEESRRTRLVPEHRGAERIGEIRGAAAGADVAADIEAGPAPRQRRRRLQRDGDGARGRVGRIEAIVEAEPKDIGLEIDAVDEWLRGKRGRERDQVAADDRARPEIDEEIFGLGAPVVAERNLDAAAGRIAETRPRDGGGLDRASGVGERILGGRPRNREAAGDVEQPWSRANPSRGRAVTSQSALAAELTVKNARGNPG